MVSEGRSRGIRRGPIQPRSSRDGTDSAGDKVRIVDAFSPDGKKLSHRVIHGNSTYEEKSDGTKVVETTVANSQKCLQVLFEKLPLKAFPKFFNTLVAGNNPDVSLATAYGKQCDSVASFGRIVNSP